MHHSLLLLQLVIILATARVCGLILRSFGQPPVIGEMAAGIVLGPIVFGAIFPEFHATLFARESLPALDSLSQLGLVLFMFIVGVEMRAPNGVRAQVKAAGAVGVLSVLLPMALGLAIAPALHPRFAPDGVSFWPFALFMASAMAITAFPIMARILKERSMTHTPVGSPVAECCRGRRRVCLDHVGLRGCDDCLARRMGGILEDGVRLAAARCRRVHSTSPALRQTSQQFRCRRAAWRRDVGAVDDRNVCVRCDHSMATAARGVRRVSVRRMPAARRSSAQDFDRASRALGGDCADAYFLRTCRAEHHSRCFSWAPAQWRCC